MGRATAFACPFHVGHTRLDGSLAGIPHEHGFPDIDMGKHGLVPVLAQESGGIIFITQNGQPGKRDPGEGLENLISADQDLIDVHDNEAEFNWKVSLEGSLEGYHIRFGHPETFTPMDMTI